MPEPDSKTIQNEKIENEIESQSSENLENEE